MSNMEESMRAKRLTPDVEVISSGESDRDSDVEFFTHKHVKRVSKKRPRKRPEPTTSQLSAASCDISDPEEGSNAERQRRRKAKARAKPPSLPEWTRSRPSQERGRSRAVERERSASITLVSDGDTPKADKGKGRATDKAKRRRVELTPPPVLAEEELADIERQSRLLEEAGVVINDVDDVVEVGSPSPVRDRSGPQVQITVQMVVDPDKRQPGREQAVAAYEKRRIFHVFETDPLSDLLHALATRVQVPVDQLILVYEGQRIFLSEKTPKQLGIKFTEGYELPVYEKVQQAERKARLALFGDNPRRTDKDLDEGEPSRRSPSPLRAPLPPAVQKVKLHLRGPKGELHFSAAPTTLVSTILKFYCNKQGVDASEAHRFRLEFDGEHFEGNSTVGDMDVESGDLIDVSYR
ncbi:hypothetical protein CcaverHIS002_0105050 [Cutaneotrichosporon cavernicola]|nr:hypothetical protein CcaverHIS002_0105050 [Cutaneotrichosporon cavernicola]